MTDRENSFPFRARYTTCQPSSITTGVRIGARKVEGGGQKDGNDADSQ